MFLFAVVIICSLANSGMNVWFSFIGREFWTALSERNARQYYLLMGKFGAALICGLPVWIFHTFYREKLAIEWRAWLTQRLLDMFQAHRKCAPLRTRHCCGPPRAGDVCASQRACPRTAAHGGARRRLPFC
jgi:ABC-type uncharacterized transport system fused permease/ATPase subunit